MRRPENYRPLISLETKINVINFQALSLDVNTDVMDHSVTQYLCKELYLGLKYFLHCLILISFTVNLLGIIKYYPL